jgi:hypothetical protein
VPNISSSDTASGAEASVLTVYIGDNDQFNPTAEGASWIGDSEAGSADDEELVQYVAPYTPPQYVLSPLRALYRSLVQVVRLNPLLQPGGALSMSWENVSDILDPYLPDKPGQLWCRLDVGFMRPGKDIPMPITAGRAPDRVALMFFDPAFDAGGRSLVKAGDRFECLAGPVYGTWEVRLIPEVAQDYLGAHHMEIQVVEVSQALQPGSLTPFPGAQL